MRVFGSVWERVSDKFTMGGGCWEWQGAKTRDGYGKFRVAPKTHTSHRLVYELLIGPIPDGLELDHLCRNHGCVNPDHLEPVTHAENQQRNKKTHCVRGHEYRPETTYIYTKADGKTQRFCAPCMKARVRERALRQQAAQLQGA